MTSERLTHPEPENWLLPYRTYNGWRYSPLSQINRRNVAKLKLAFAVPLGVRTDGAGENQAVPLVDNGFMYLIDATSTVFKIDVRGGKGKTIWTFDTDTTPRRQGTNRGVGLMDDLVLVNTRDGRALALSRETGDPVWEKQIGTPGDGFDSPPLPINDLVVIGQAFGDSATRGYVSALERKTGKERWRFYTVPGPGETGHDTWPADNDAWMTGGGGLWVASTYDPVMQRIFVGTGNPSPALDPEFRLGDNLYTNSTIALDVNTGHVAWYFQYTPNDSMERDEISPNLLFDLTTKGSRRNLLGHLSRTGYYFSFDRNSGAFLNAEPVQSAIDWTDGIDARTGKPIEYDPAAKLQRYKVNARRGEINTSSCGGGFITGSWPPAYDPIRHRVYNAFVDNCFKVSAKATYAAVSAKQRFGRHDLGGDFSISLRKPVLAALDAASGKTLAKVDIGLLSQSGILATGGGLLYLGLADGTIQARDADSLAVAWSINLGMPLKAAPIAYAVDGKEYIAILGGGGPLAYLSDVPEIAKVRDSSVLWVFSL